MAKKPTPGEIVQLESGENPVGAILPEPDQFAVTEFDVKVEALTRAVDLVSGYHGRLSQVRTDPAQTVIDYAKKFEAYLEPDLHNED